jgi:hypothetical protein
VTATGPGFRPTGTVATVATALPAAAGIADDKATHKHASDARKTGDFMCRPLDKPFDEPDHDGETRHAPHQD